MVSRSQGCAASCLYCKQVGGSGETGGKASVLRVQGANQRWRPRGAARSPLFNKWCACPGWLRGKGRGLCGEFINTRIPRQPNIPLYFLNGLELGPGIGIFKGVASGSGHWAQEPLGRAWGLEGQSKFRKLCICNDLGGGLNPSENLVLFKNALCTDS